MREVGIDHRHPGPTFMHSMLHSLELQFGVRCSIVAVDNSVVCFWEADEAEIVFLIIL